MAERRQAEDTERQRRLFQCAPGFIAILRGREHVFEFVNEAYVRLLGDRNFVGKTARERPWPRWKIKAELFSTRSSN